MALNAGTMGDPKVSIIDAGFLSSNIREIYE